MKTRLYGCVLLTTLTGAPALASGYSFGKTAFSELNNNYIVYSIEFHQNKFHAICKDTGMIRKYYSAAQVDVVDTSNCVISIISDLSFAPVGMRSVISGNQLILQSSQNEDVLIFNKDDISSILQKQDRIDGEPNAVMKLFWLIGGIIVPTAILSIYIFARMAS